MKYAVTISTLFLLITSVWAGTLRDNFEDNNFDGWRLWKFGDQTAEWSVKDGEVVCVSKNNCSWASDMMIGDNTWMDYDFEVQFKLEKTFSPAGCVDRGTGIGVGVRQDETTGINSAILGVYTLGVGPNWDKVLCQFFIQGNGQNPHSGNFKTQAGKWYTLRFVVNGNSYEASLMMSRFVSSKLIYQRGVEQD